MKAALGAAFPEFSETPVKADKKTQTEKSSNNRWTDPSCCKQFFEEYAAEQGFDPNKAESWYATNLKDMLKKKVLCACFPSLISCLPMIDCF